MLKRLPIREDWVLGVDLGIGSCGTALVQLGEEPRILFMGSRCFEVPEFPKDKKLKNAVRRVKRLTRRIVRRRRARMAEIRELFARSNVGILYSVEPEAIHNQSGVKAIDPYEVRSQGLDRPLTRLEFAIALLHIAKHRGFKSTKKSEFGVNRPPDVEALNTDPTQGRRRATKSHEGADDAAEEEEENKRKMLAAIAANQVLVSRYESAGQMLFKDAKFARRKRNSDRDYSHTLARDDLEREAKKLFERQRRFGNSWASAEVEAEYLAIAFRQEKASDSEPLVGDCPFERGEKRSAKHAFSFELFRFLCRLNSLRVKTAAGGYTRLLPEQIKKLAADFGTQKTLTYRQLQAIFWPSSEISFKGIDGEKLDKDICASAGAAEGTFALRKALGPELWRQLVATPEVLDRIASILAFRDSIDSITHGLSQLALGDDVLAAVTAGVRAGTFARFKGAGHISAKAARAMVPGLMSGKEYDKAAAEAGYDPSARREVLLQDIRNAVVVRALREALAQVMSVVREFGARPAQINVELAREIGKSAKERAKIVEGLERRNAEKERRRKEFMRLTGRPQCTDEELLRYELWKEQGHRCMYAPDSEQDHYIKPMELVAENNSIQIDHVLPRSKYPDNSYYNRVLCRTRFNQRKKEHTPYEWIIGVDGNKPWWNELVARVEALRIKGFKKRNLLLEDFNAFLERHPPSRNLNDTKYAARALLGELRKLYPELKANPAPRRLYARPGAVTAMLRKAWGLEDFKKNSDGKRIGDDRHHALDALICACCTEQVLQRITNLYRKQDEKGKDDFIPPIKPPWTGFYHDAVREFQKVFVSRSERRRARGQGHLDTIRQVREQDGTRVVYERRSVDLLTLADLARIKDPDRNRKTIDALRAWIEKGKPKDDPPRSPKGDPIRKVRLRTNTKSGVPVREGLADNAAMVRVDVFSKDGRFYLVPIYVHQVMNKATNQTPPNRAIVGNKPEGQWILVDSSFDYRFALFPDSYVEIIKSDGQIVKGYYRATDRNTGALTISPNHAHDKIVKGIGARTLREIRKYTVDRLGRKFPVGREKRTWHGVVCT